MQAKECALIDVINFEREQNFLLPSEENLQCTALIFYCNEQTDWQDFLPCFFEWIRNMENDTNTDDVSIVYQNRKMQKIACLEEIYEHDPERALPPQQMYFFEKGKCKISSLSEYWWLNGGGNFPFCDSYTIKFYTTRQISSLIRESFIRVCKLHDIALREYNEPYNEKHTGEKTILQKILSFFMS